ncbi:unnamed protein product [Brugia timori]|uniref:Uncharacterized protein n=1 Tax=Brugia timori TaxID=42155 RepID=A0A0R3QBZ5_9BILA|nr:unnamed protein product [Brugia timori]
MKNANFGINAPNGLIIPEKINNEKIKGDEITQQNTFTTATTDNGLQGVFFFHLFYVRK